MGLSFVTVTFSKEFLLQKLQARSFAQFVDRDCIDEIIIILNDADNTGLYRKILECGVLDEYKDLKDLVKIKFREDIIKYKFRNRGWRNQQALKLAASQIVQNEYMVILDSKNHFVRPVDMGAFVGSDGRPYSFRGPKANDVMPRQYRFSMELFGNDPDAYGLCPLPVITPYTMYTSIVRDMIQEFDKENGKYSLFRLFLDTKNFVSEFFLYMSYILYKYNDADGYYHFRERFVETLFKSAIINHNTGATISRAGQKHVHTFGIHRLALPLLGVEQMSDIAKFWHETGLFPDMRSAQDCITSLASPGDGP